MQVMQRLFHHLHKQTPFSPHFREHLQREITPRNSNELPTLSKKSDN